MQFEQIQQKFLHFVSQRYVSISVGSLLVLLILYTIYSPLQILVLNPSTTDVQNNVPAINNERLQTRLNNIHPFGNSQSLKDIPIASLGLQLQAIFINPKPEQSQVLIAMTGQAPQSYKAGAIMPNGIQIYKILPDSVILSQGGNLVKLELPIQPIEFSQTTNTSLFAGEQSNGQAH